MAISQQSPRVRHVCPRSGRSDSPVVGDTGMSQVIRQYVPSTSGIEGKGGSRGAKKDNRRTLGRQRLFQAEQLEFLISIDGVAHEMGQLRGSHQRNVALHSWRLCTFLAESALF